MPLFYFYFIFFPSLFLTGLSHQRIRRSRAFRGTTRFCCRDVKIRFSQAVPQSASQYPTEWSTSRSNSPRRTGKLILHRFFLDMGTGLDLFLNLMKSDATFFCLFFYQRTYFIISSAIFFKMSNTFVYKLSCIQTFKLRIKAVFVYAF